MTMLYRWAIYAPSICVFHVRARSEREARKAARYIIGMSQDERLPKGTLIENLGPCEYQPEDE